MVKTTKRVVKEIFMKLTCLFTFKIIQLLKCLPNIINTHILWVNSRNVLEKIDHFWTNHRILIIFKKIFITFFILDV